jgi:hypothetical protein
MEGFRKLMETKSEEISRIVIIVILVFDLSQLSPYSFLKCTLNIFDVVVGLIVKTYF